MKTYTQSLGLMLMTTSALVAPAAFAQTDQTAVPADAQTVEVTEATPTEEITEIVVRGKNVPNTMRRTAEVTAILTNEDLKRTGDDSAAVALTRVTGLSLVEGRFVYVRGLGERYSSALLNGSPLPSPEPLQRVVPLDLFPSSILQRVSVQKTYSAEYPGEFGGGVIDLRTLNTPKAPFLSMGLSVSGNSETTFQDGYTHYGSDTDPIGFDDGTRSLPPELRTALHSGRRINAGNYSDATGYFTPAQLQKIGQSFSNAPLNLIQQTDSLPANFSFNLSGGTSMDVAGGQFGIVGLVDFGNGWKARNGIQQDGRIEGTGAARTVELVGDYKYQTTENNVGLNGLIGMGYNIGGHSLQWTNLFIRNTTKRTRVREGRDIRNTDSLTLREDTGWYARQLVMSQLTGRHPLSDKLAMDWRLAYAKTTRDAPYERDITYWQDAKGVFFHAGTQQTNNLQFSNLEDVAASGGASLTYDFSLGEARDGKLTGGFDFLDNKRESENRSFRFNPGTGIAANNIQYSRVDYLFSDVNISPTRWVLTETTNPNAAYDGGLFVNAAYAKVDVEVIPLVRLAAGLRYEYAKQRVTLNKLYESDQAPVKIPALKEEYVLPTATVTWNFRENMQLRGGLSKTIGRPQFRELAPAQYLDPEQDRLFVGNPYLRDTELTNFDARYEWYYDAGSYFTAGAFYKDITNPVEASLLVQGNSLFQTYINAPEASLYGVEFDYKGLFDSPVSGAFFDSKRWLLQANYTYTSSEVKASGSQTIIDSNGQAQKATNFIISGSRMQGQAENVANLQFGWDDAEAKSQATFLVTYVSERISARGNPSSGVADYIQEPGATLDFVYRKGFTAFGRDLNLGVEVRNLTGTKFQEYQEEVKRVDVNKYDLGQSVSVSLSTQF
ncbi:MAG: TonB-dependent receptor [Asticcacaulis sp.]|uniref:TonB-dependent receptor domain-containing protein n=1 Tax=Asticcacaulis sp. TaxID=1872648 RepID=UPI0025BB89E5|nr:TonB-dependent receptor [Asticcacaulis sp.]MCA1936011.1 TonB-dependent receptor [Asticcacaulis sp.]